MVGMWKPNLEDISSSFDRRGLLLRKAIKKIVDEHNENLKKGLKDKTRKVWGYVTDKYVVVAKRYIYGNIVSCHAEACFLAFNLKKKIVMYIEDMDKFYVFDPVEVIFNSERNYRRGILMFNFDIKLGRRL